MTVNGSPQRPHMQWITHAPAGPAKPLPVVAAPVEEGGEFTCPVCSKEFGTARGTGMHIRKIHPDFDES